ncbi:hypothetical protein BJV82DRAFT_636498 [Fennellomyces sp. T-0311]|nr:hypothetical protein BJV82DRAFT_636498 [Fennellomyces sp. T-0311]
MLVDSQNSVEELVDPKARQRELESAFCRNFLCCGQTLLDLHELLHHFEEHHVVSDEEEDDDDDMLMAWTTFPMEEYAMTTAPVMTTTTMDPINATFHEGFLPAMDVGSPSSSGSSEGLCTPPPSPPLKKRKFPMEWHPGDLELLLQQANSIDPYGCYDDAHERPYKCQVDGCDKAYKNANGLKYHKAHGHCHEKHENESELNARKPYRCSIGICNKRYKNLNGLKYHIEHTHLAKLRQPIRF